MARAHSQETFAHGVSAIPLAQQQDGSERRAIVADWPLSDRRHHELLVKFSRANRQPSARRLHVLAMPARDQVEDLTAPETRRSAIDERSPVLIVDSYRDEGEMYADYLRTIGIPVDYVATPEEALPLLHERAPAVVVTDMVFTGSRYDGPAFMRAVRALPACALTSCIIVSGYPRIADRESARAAGADLFLVKPCAPDELSRYIEHAVSAYDRNRRPEWNWPE